MGEFKINDVLYFAHNTQAITCTVEEIIKHYTKKGLIEKIIVRFYGMKDYHTVEKENLYSTFNEAKKIAKEKLDQSYKKAYKNLEDVTEEFCSNKEVKYQEELKKLPKKDEK